jgi:hypothetical protein
VIFLNQNIIIPSEYAELIVGNSHWTKYQVLADDVQMARHLPLLG